MQTEQVSLETLLSRRFQETNVHIMDRGSLLSYLNLLKYHDIHTYEHSIRVGIIGSNIAKYSGLGFNAEKILLMSGLIHDLGKVEMPVSLLRKTENFTEEDMKKMKEHPVITYRKVNKRFALSSEVALRHHAVQHDGYPSYLPKPVVNFSEKTMDMIALYANYLSLVDYYDAATHRINSEHGTKRKLKKEEVKKYLMKKYPSFDGLINSMYDRRVFGGVL